MELKNEIFSRVSVNGSNFTPTYSSQAICGEIVRIIVKGVQSPVSNGSLWIAESGTDIEIWRSNALASGTNRLYDIYPFVYPVDSVNTTGSPQAFLRRIVNSPIYYAGSGFTSGTTPTFGPIEVFFR